MTPILCFFVLQLEEAKELVKDAIFAGIFNDLGSGSSCDLCVITKDGTDFIRGHAKPNERTFKREYNFNKGATPILGEHVEVLGGSAMDL